MYISVSHVPIAVSHVTPEGHDSLTHWHSQVTTHSLIVCDKVRSWISVSHVPHINTSWHSLSHMHDIKANPVTQNGWTSHVPNSNALHRTHQCVMAQTQDSKPALSHPIIEVVVSHIPKSHVPHWVMSHISMRHVPHINESCPTYQSVVSPTESCLTWHCVMSHISMRHVPHINESCPTYQWVMSHISKCRVPYWVLSLMTLRHVPHINESRHFPTHQCVMAQTHDSKPASSHTMIEWVMSHVSVSHGAFSHINVTDTRLEASVVAQ